MWKIRILHAPTNESIWREYDTFEEFIVELIKCVKSGLEFITTVGYNEVVLE